MTDESLFDKGQKTVEILGQVLKAAGDNDSVKQAGAEVGKSALTITRTINNVLLPLAALNHSLDKAREYFSEKFQKDVEEKLQAVSEDDLIDPNVSVVGPAIQGLAFTHDEDALREMYLNLISGSMQKSKSYHSHPAFSEIVKQLTSDEAIFFENIAIVGETVPVANIQLKGPKINGHHPLGSHIYSHLLYPNTDTSKIAQVPRMVENWIRLGLVVVKYDQWITAEGSYDWFDTHPLVLMLKQTYEKDEALIQIGKGTISMTSFGKSFALAVGLT